MDRVEERDVRRLAVLGLHDEAGTSTVLASLVAATAGRGRTPAVTSADVWSLEFEPVVLHRERVNLPAGAFAATGLAVLEEGGPAVEIVERSSHRTPRGALGIVRTKAAGELDLCGPLDTGALEPVVTRLAEVSGGRVLVGGRWQRRAFASPDVCDGVVLVVGAGMSSTPAHSAAAVRHVVEVLAMPACGDHARLAWEAASSKQRILVVGTGGRVLSEAAAGSPDPTEALAGVDPREVETIALPGSLQDEFVVPLIRNEFRCGLLVRDPTRVHLAPVYYRAWLKGGGRFEVVRRTSLVAVATNPANARGADADGAEFRRLVEEAVEGVPVHDVVLEARGRPRRGWRLWG